MKHLSKKKLMNVFFSCLLSNFFCMTNLYASDKDMRVHVKIFTNEDLNKDEQDHASPLKIIFLQLLKKASFEQLDEVHIEDDYKECFGPDLLDEYSLMIQPDEIKEFDIDVVGDAQYLGVILVFRDLSGSWKTLFEKQELRFFSRKKNYLNFEINEDQLIQVNLEDAAKLTLNKQLKKLEKAGLDVSGLSEKALKKLESKIEKSSIPKVKNELKKGIYKEY